MGLPVFSSAGGAAGTTGTAAAGGRSCAHRTPHANRSNASFRMARKGYLTGAIWFKKYLAQPVTSSAACAVFLLNPRYDSGRTHPYHPNAPATQTLGDYSSNIPSNSVVLR